MADVTKTQILDKVTVNEKGCWLWKGNLNQAGYGYENRKFMHRVAYELWVGPIPKGLQLDHRCNVKKCVNPLHLRPATRGMNKMFSHAHLTGQMSRRHLRTAKMIHRLVGEK